MSDFNVTMKMPDDDFADMTIRLPYTFTREQALRFARMIEREYGSAVLTERRESKVVVANDEESA